MSWSKVLLEQSAVVYLAKKLNVYENQIFKNMSEQLITGPYHDPTLF
jgi:hypothetical protein